MEIASQPLSTIAMRVIITVALGLLTLHSARPEEPPSMTETQNRTQFAGDQRDRSIWRPIRLPNQSVARTFIQREDSLATDAFTPEEIKAQQDNVLLAAPCDPSTAQIQVTLSIGPEPGAAAGFFLAENCSDDTFLSGTVIFVAQNRFAIWEVVANVESRETKYTHLVQLAHTFPVGEKHVLTCAFDKKGGLAVQVDDTDVLSLRKCRVGSTLGIWGCHGSTYFYDLTQQPTATLSGVAK